jgi:hypothetical protein
MLETFIFYCGPFENHLVEVNRSEVHNTQTTKGETSAMNQTCQAAETTIRQVDNSISSIIPAPSITTSTPPSTETITIRDSKQKIGKLRVLTQRLVHPNN